MRVFHPYYSWREWGGRTMSLRELLGELAGLITSVIFCCLVIFGVWENTPGYWFWALLPVVAALLHFGAVSWDLKSGKVPFWCLPELTGRRRLHRFADIGDPYVKPRIWECSLCGVHREVVVKSTGSTDGGE